LLLPRRNCFTGLRRYKHLDDPGPTLSSAVVALRLSGLPTPLKNRRARASCSAVHLRGDLVLRVVLCQEGVRAFCGWKTKPSRHARKRSVGQWKPSSWFTRADRNDHKRQTAPSHKLLKPIAPSHLFAARALSARPVTSSSNKPEAPRRCIVTTLLVDPRHFGQEQHHHRKSSEKSLSESGNVPYQGSSLPNLATARGRWPRAALWRVYSYKP